MGKREFGRYLGAAKKAYPATHPAGQAQIAAGAYQKMSPGSERASKWYEKPHPLPKGENPGKRVIVGKLNRYWENQLRQMMRDLRMPFSDILSLEINIKTSEISVIKQPGVK